MAPGSKPLATSLAAVSALFDKSCGTRYGLTVVVFQQILEQVAAKYLPSADPAQKLKLWQELRIEELALARGCAAGHEQAWQEFLTRYREKLYDIARGITKEDSSARDLADSLYADLYGTSERQGQRLCRLSSYMGRGSLEGWLRTVLAQEFVNRYRKQKRLVSLEEQQEEGVQFSSTDHLPQGPIDGRLGAATDEALERLAAEDRLVLAAYYLDDRTLTEIGRLLGVHESTISRRLEKLLKTLRKQVIAGLQARGMDRSQAEEALEADVRYLVVDVKRKLQENQSAAFQQNKGSD
ncbi:MAG TPA: sigma-70 family RNA polymerase sigma factor [Verrucomicrobiae bacterium]|jgi:RNA polymerase sigma-70 factor (ECF subfamily)|nr:sigma-70 family RNA polymerase sigma factor [Verrucomicrobiae bacterium]